MPVIACFGFRTVDYTTTGVNPLAMITIAMVYFLRKNKPSLPQGEGFPMVLAAMRSHCCNTL
jgi:hypothetical protein